MPAAKMDDLDYQRRVQAALDFAYQQSADPTRRSEYLALKAEAAKRIRSATVRPSIVFDLSMSGYVTLGLEGNERTFLDPGLAGLEYAWRIFLNGVAAKDALHASDLLDSPGPRPGNTVRTRIAAAAEWVERAAGCPPLAVAMRRPSISISDAGEIEHDPARGPRIILKSF